MKFDELPPVNGKRSTRAIADVRREAFCRHYVKHWNAVAAGKAAGYSYSHAMHLCVEPEIIARIQELNEAMLKAADITAARVMLELGRIGFSDIRKIVGPDGRLLPLSEIDDDTAAAIAGIDVEHRVETTKETDLVTGEKITTFTPVVTTRIKKTDKVAALNILAKHFKLVGDEGDGVNALASALADRLNTAKRRELPPPNQEIEDARIIDNDAAGVRRGEGQEVSQPGDRDRAVPASE